MVEDEVPMTKLLPGGFSLGPFFGAGMFLAGGADNVFSIVKLFDEAISLSLALYKGRFCLGWDSVKPGFGEVD